LSRRSRSVILPGFRWFVLRVEGSYEQRAAQMLEMCGRSGKVPDFDLVRRIWVPRMSVQFFTPDGTIAYRRVSILPGYLLLKAILSYELYTALRRPSLPHVFGWLRCGKSWPSEVPRSDIRGLLRLEAHKREFQPLFSVGENVRLTGLGLEGVVREVAPSHLSIEISFFKRKTLIEVPRERFAEVVRVNA